MSTISRSVRNLRALSRALTWIGNPAPVEGLHHVPPSGPYILAANHLGMLDLPLIYAEVGSDDLAGWVAEKWEHHWLLGPLMRAGNGIFIQRGEIDRAALDAAVAWLQAGRIFGMAPEGTRSRSGALGRGKTGIVYIAHKADVPILPVVCIGTEGAFASLLRLRRRRVAVRFGPAFRLPPLEASRRTEVHPPAGRRSDVPPGGALARELPRSLQASPGCASPGAARSRRLTAKPIAINSLALSTSLPQRDSLRAQGEADDGAGRTAAVPPWGIVEKPRWQGGV